MQRDETCSGHDTGLAKAAAEYTPEGVGTGDERLGAGQHGAHRRADSLGEAKADALSVARDDRWLDIERGAGIEQPGAVDVGRDSCRAASLPVSCAASASSACTVGSPSNVSSPSVARRMASHMASVG